MVDSASSLDGKTQGESRRFFSNRDLFKLLLPLVVEQGLEFTVGLAASMMVAFVGESAVSGVSLVDFVMALIISLFAALATGGAVIAGQYLGGDDRESSTKAANQLVRFAAVVSLAIMVIMYLIKPLILNGLFGEITYEVRSAADTYLTIVALSIPFIALYNAGAAIFRTMGDSKLPMKIMIAMNILNVAGNALFVFGFQMGVEGVAIPTLVSRVGAAVIVLVLLMDPKRVVYIERSLRQKLDLHMIKRILNIGVPYGLENGLFYLGRLLVLSLVATFGTAAIAANSVAGAIVLFEVLPGMAIGLGLTVVVSHCVGAGDFFQARYYTKKIVGIIYVCNIISCACVLALLPAILDIYGLSQTATDMTTQIVWWHAAFTIVFWPLGYSLSSTFRAAGDAKFPLIVSVSTMIVCRIALAYVLSVLLGMGMFGTWIAMFFDWVVKGGVYLWRYLSGKWTRFDALQKATADKNMRPTRASEARIR